MRLPCFKPCGLNKADFKKNTGMRPPSYDML
jgi:hypothetical protein